MSDLKFQAPITVNAEVFITNGKQTGKVTVGVSNGSFPTEQDFQDAIEKVRTSEDLPEGFRVMTKPEWWRAFCAENFGQNIAMPGGEDWDK